MRRKLTDVGAQTPGKLTSRIDGPFIISIKYKLLKDFTFSDMQISDLKEFQKFLNCVSCLTFNEVETKYKKKPDKNDKYLDRDVVHYGTTSGFRIHGIIEEGRFKLLRIDPNHKVHG